MRVFAALVVFAPLAPGQRLIAPDPHAASFRLPPAFLRGAGTFGDLDGDQLPDIAVAEPQGFSSHLSSYRVAVHLSSNDGSAFEIRSRAPGGLHLTALDVDGDHDLDLVVVTEQGRQAVGVWINDGKGSFSEGDASAYPSSIWKQPSTWFERPAGDSPERVVLAPVFAGLALEEVNIRTSLARSRLPIYKSPDHCSDLFIGCAGPSRAPPLS